MRGVRSRQEKCNHGPSGALLMKESVDFFPFIPRHVGGQPEPVIRPLLSEENVSDVGLNGENY